MSERLGDGGGPGAGEHRGDHGPGPGETLPPAAPADPSAIPPPGRQPDEPGHQATPPGHQADAPGQQATPTWHQAPPPASTPGWSEHGWPPLQPGPRPPAPVSLRDLLVALIVGLVVAALGAPLALLWNAIGPHVEVVMTTAGPSLDDYNTEAFVGGDAIFGAIAVGAGIVVGIIAWALRRWRGPAMLIGFTLGGIASAWITWKLGHQIGLSHYEDLIKNADPGQRFDQPMKLRAHGLLFMQSTVAVIVYVVNAAWSHRADLGTGKDAPAPADSATSAHPPAFPQTWPATPREGTDVS